MKNKEPTVSAVILMHDLLLDALVLTKRSKYLRTHPGEISFPGGIREEVDANLYETGLRELNEELGISRDRVSLVRSLEQETTLLGTIIHPWMVEIKSTEPYQLNKDEVSSLLFVPISLVTDPANYREITIEHKGMHFKTQSFIPENGIIWGATARIMMQLIEEPK